MKDPEVREIHKKVSQILPEVAPDFDHCELWDNDVPPGADPILIAAGGKPLTAVPGMEDKLQAFIDKGKE